MIVTEEDWQEFLDLCKEAISRGVDIDSLKEKVLRETGNTDNPDIRLALDSVFYHMAQELKTNA